MYVAEEKNSRAELTPAAEFFIPLKFSAREPSGEQENLLAEENDSSFSSGASTKAMPRAPHARVRRSLYAPKSIRSPCNHAGLGV